MEIKSEVFLLPQDLYQHFIDKFRYRLLGELRTAIKSLSLDYAPYYWQHDKIPNDLRKNYNVAENSNQYDEILHAVKKLMEILNYGKARTRVIHSLHIIQSRQENYMIYEQKPY